MKSKAYHQAGVSLDAADEVVERVKPLAQSTFRPGVMGGLGGFGGLFHLDPKKWNNPVLVSGTDGVGTKLKLAFQLKKHDTIGIDLVAMCVNDILVQGAEPLFFLDYLACGKLFPDQVGIIVSGISEGCRQANCALIGGETAEMPGMYVSEEYDLAGFAVGVVEQDEIIDGRKIQEGDILLGLPSSGVHSNGYSLVRKILDKTSTDFNQSVDDSKLEVDPKKLGELLLEPTRIYVKPVLKLLQSLPIKGMAHITGGGLPGNIPRILPEGTAVQLDSGSWDNLLVFEWLEKNGNLSKEEMLPVFNMGIGFVICVSAEDVDATLSLLQNEGEKPRVIGRVVRGNRNVILE